MNYQLMIISGAGSLAMQPVVVEEVILNNQLSGSPGELHFTCVKTKGLNFSEGDEIHFSVEGKKIFHGFVFEKRRDKFRDKMNPLDTRRRGERLEVDSHHIKVIAYDQLRYFKNKDTYVYEGKTASQLIQMLSNDFLLRTGYLANTKYVIPRRREEDKTLFDIVKYALDVTLIQEKKLYVLYDDVGFLTLKNVEDMKLDIVIDDDTAGDFDYKTTIDDNTYNTVKLVRSAGKQADTGKDVVIEQDITNQKQWGVLQYYQNIDNDEINMHDRAKQLLSLMNRKTRKLKIRKAIGDIRVRAGCSVMVSLNLGDIVVNNMFLVSRCNHIFGNGYHWMDLDLIGVGIVDGGEFV